MGGSSSNTTYDPVAMGDDPLLKSYVTSTQEGQKYADLYKNVAAAGQNYYQINGVYGAAKPGDGGENYGFANNQYNPVNDFMSAFMKWQALQKQQDSAWESYSNLAAQNQGRDQTILGGAAQSQYSSIMASLGNPNPNAGPIGSPVSPQIKARTRTGVMGVPS